MSVSDGDFLSWLMRTVGEQAPYVANVKTVGRFAQNTLYVGRQMRNDPPGSCPFGNPYTEYQYGRVGAIKRYVAKLAAMPETERALFLRPIWDALVEGKQLLCWCAPEACHAHVLAGWAQKYATFYADQDAAKNAAPVVPLERHPGTVILPQMAATPDEIDHSEAAPSNPQEVLATPTPATLTGPRFARND